MLKDEVNQARRVELATWRHEIASRSSGIYALVVDIEDRLSAPDLSEIASLLDPEERMRAGGFRSLVDRNRFVLAHAVLRIAVGWAAHVAPDLIEFRTGPRWNRAPELSRPFGLNLNLSLSHSGSYVAIGLCLAHSLGIDIEENSPIEDLNGLARSVLGEDEFDLWLSVNGSEQAALIYRFWTSKEAALKAYGLGFSVAPNRLRISCDVAHNPKIAQLDGVEPFPAIEVTTLECRIPRPAILAIASTNCRQISVAFASAEALFCQSHQQMPR